MHLASACRRTTKIGRAPAIAPSLLSHAQSGAIRRRVWASSIAAVRVMSAANPRRHSRQQLAQIRMLPSTHHQCANGGWMSSSHTVQRAGGPGTVWSAVFQSMMTVTGKSPSATVCKRKRMATREPPYGGPARRVAVRWGCCRANIYRGYGGYIGTDIGTILARYWHGSFSRSLCANQPAGATAVAAKRLGFDPAGIE
jgi:hypothetical protein